jgi:hypothetical protein
LKFRRAHQLEQHKLCVEMANHVSSRRDTFSALAFQEVVRETSGNRHDSARVDSSNSLDRRGDRHFRRRECLAPNTGVIAVLE